MQTQAQQISKKNKVTVPFYSPPFNLLGQTPADIIKEARTAIMTSSSVSIKPVHTSRPFTPNEKERTLFGKVKKYSSRPPSSFSLRHMKSQEPTARVKLPSIEIVSKRKNYATLHFSKNLSLDNLTEGYDAETFKEIKSTNQEKLPAWKKAHSCPKEGRLSKVASLNDLNRSLTNGKSYSKVYGEGYLGYLEKNNLKGDQNFSDMTALGTFGDSVKIQYCKAPVVPQNPEMSKGGGDYEVSASIQSNLLAESSASRDKALISDVNVTSQKAEKKNVSGMSEGEADLSKPAGTKGEKNISGADENLKNLEKDIMETREEKQFQELNHLGKTIIVAEKSLVTESKSDYIISLMSGFKSQEIINYSRVIPQEILDLYETARFYGIDVNLDGNINSSVESSSEENTVVREGNFSEKKSDYYSMEEVENFKKTFENLNDGTVTEGSANEKARDTSENIEFSMNNKKLGEEEETVGDKGDIREKAHKIWNHDAPQVPVLNNTWDLFWKNSYFGEKDEKDEGQEDLRQIIDKIARFVKKGAESRLIYETISQLYGSLKSGQVLLGSKLKKTILRSLYLCVDIEDAEVLLGIAKILFYLKEESSLSVACKIIFKVARFDTNDYLFLQEGDLLELFLEGIGRASPLECPESAIYSYGALKFLTLNHYILSRILHYGALDLMVLHLKMINSAYIENRSVGEQTQHALFQLTGALRNVAAGEGALPLFLTTHSITIICNTLRYFAKDEDVVVNISRMLSILSTDETVTQALMHVEDILSTLIDLIERYRENDKILIRLAFCLGNIVEHSDLARIQLSRSDTALTILLNVLQVYIDKDLEISLKEHRGKNLDVLSSEEIDDVIVKVIRIIANMSMNPIVGSNLSPTTKEKKSLQLSKLLSILLMRKDPGIVLLATLGCLNNISYYCNTHSVLVDITQGVERVLGLDSVECQIEAARVLGNLTRHKEIRDLIDSTGGVDVLVKLLSSADQEVVRCSCGALVNMLLNSETRKRFVETQGIDKLIKTLEIFPDEWSLAGLVARAIWNSCGDDVSSAMMHNNVENLLNFLTASLEEENWNDGDVAWEEFASVATDLLEKISLHLEST